MQNYELTLKSDVSKTFRCQKAADSLDIDVEKKSIHHFKVKADIESDFSIGLILGASGSGKTTLAKHIFGEDCFKTPLDINKPIIEQFDKKYSYEECAKMLSGIGLTSVPCWIRPVKTLSNGQRVRAESALLMSQSDEEIIIDEWTSVVDRTIAKAMSHCVQKHARKVKKKIILLSCHYDVVEWVNPDWIIDCNLQTFQDRRSLRPEERKRNERLKFSIKKVDRKSWKYFSKYHYLSERLPGGKLYIYGLFDNNNQIGFICYANYTPSRQDIFHFNRLIIHPDYCGLGIGNIFLNEVTKIFINETNFKVFGKFSSTPVFKSLIKDKNWKLKKIARDLLKSKRGAKIGNKVIESFRTKVKTYSFEYVG